MGYALARAEARNPHLFHGDGTDDVGEVDGVGGAEPEVAAVAAPEPVAAPPG